MTSIALALLLLTSAAPDPQQDVVVFCDTPCGIAAALAAAREGCSVSLVAEGKHVGGMMSSGLSITDVRIPTAHGGLFQEFLTRIEQHYIDKYGRDSQEHRCCNAGLWFEPHVAEQVFRSMLAEEPRITLLAGQRLVDVKLADARLEAIVIEDRRTGHHRTLRADTFIDAGYEGDLAAATGVECRVGRESREEYWEPYAGRVFLENPGLKLLPGSSGEADYRIQAYNYRLCMTDRPDLRVPIPCPNNYQPDLFAPLIPLAQAGELKELGDVIRLAPIPGGKYSANNRPIVRSLDLPEVNTLWPEANEQRRRKIVASYRDYTLGLLWFLQHDKRLPESLRHEVQQWGLCRDEFADNGHLPYSLYIREARRIVGKKTFTAHDAFLAPNLERTPIHCDSIAAADYHVDSHLVQRRAPDWPWVEGHVYLRPISKPAQVPFGVMVPRRIEGLLVSGAVSATHLGFSVLRMEPVWMALGEAAGTAAALSHDHGIPVSKVPVPLLQHKLLEAGQVICFFYDVPGPDPIWLLHNMPQERARLDLIPEPNPAIQYFGTKGYFGSYYARPNDPVTRLEAARWLHRFVSGKADLPAPQSSDAYTDVPADHPDSLVLATLSHAKLIDSWAQSKGFFPSASLSRADAAQWISAWMCRWQQWKLDEDFDPPWNDLGSESPAHTSFLLLGSHRVLPERWDTFTAIEPRHYITRAEFCEMLYRCEFHEVLAETNSP